MATVAPPADQASDLLQKLSLDSQAKASEIPEPNKKTAVYQYGGVDVHGQVPSYDRSLTPMLPSDAVDPSVCYVPNAYQPYYYGYGSSHDWSEYTAYTNPDGVDMNSGVYGDNGSLVYPQGYGYAAYPYSPATSPAPQVGGDGQLYGAQQYQYPAYFPPTTSSGPFATSVATQGDLSANKAGGVKAIPAESNNVASATGMAKGSNGSAPVKPIHQSTLNTSSNLYGNGAPGGGYAAGYHQDPRYSYDGYYGPVSCYDGSKFSDVQRPVSGSGVAPSYSKTNSVPSSRNQNYLSNSHYSGMHQPASMTGYGTSQGFYNRIYPSKLYGQYGSTGRSGMGYGSSGYDSRTNGRGWANATDNKYRSWGRGNNYFYGNENNVDGLNELNRGPRAKGTKNQKGNSEDSIEVKEQTGESNVTEAVETENACVVPDREQYNKEDFPVEYANAMFFIIKSYSEDDVHKSIKYNVWASTPNGNKKLAAAYQEAQQKPGGCPIFLFFSVNASGQFVGLAEMTGPVDFNTNVEYWQQDKWTGSFPLKWHIVKDVPNSLLKHITLENNENKPVTNSRDTQEVKLEQGLKIVKIFKEHSSKTCILDDFSFYEVRQKTILEKKAKQQQTQKQVPEEKTSTDEKKESATTDSANKESAPAVETTGDVKVAENESVANKPVGVVANGY
uniref:YTH domain-containing family protein n=1 Tax=Noccaea caerulescens TaxID=107243 RepID=A0A1J3CHZ6_NOCCA